MPREVVERVQTRGVAFQETDDLGRALREADVVYMTRIQRERFAEPAEYDRVKDAYVLTRAALAKAKPSITVMHPLPRVNEIATDVDALPGAAYFRQSANGVPIRMALLALLLS
jgi:aspartate carbamoyltransferase catalytic subunit